MIQLQAELYDAGQENPLSKRSVPTQWRADSITASHPFQIEHSISGLDSPICL